MLKNILLIFGVIFVIIGLLGFIPAFTPGGMLLGFFHVDTLHNLVHLLTGIIALLVGYNFIDALTPKLFFKIFGVVYGLVAILGFFYGNLPILGILVNNIPDAFLHSGIALVSLYLGFFYTDF